MRLELESGDPCRPEKKAHAIAFDVDRCAPSRRPSVDKREDREYVRHQIKKGAVLPSTCPKRGVCSAEGCASRGLARFTRFGFSGGARGVG